MKAVVQRVTKASVTVEDKIVGSIDEGLVILLGVKEGDTEEDARWLADKCANLRIFENEDGKFDTSVLDIKAEILAVSQFTLYGNCRKGRRPSFTHAAPPDIAKSLYQHYVNALRKTGIKVETGIFAARMHVEIHNNGPVTLIVDSEGR